MSVILLTTNFFVLVESSSAAVPTQLHFYHSHLQQMQSNQTQTHGTLKDLKKNLQTITKEVRTHLNIFCKSYYTGQQNESFFSVLI